MTTIESILDKAEIRRDTKFGTISIDQRSFTEHVDCYSELREHLLQFQLSPRLPNSHNSRGCYSRRWGMDRFESIGTAFLFPACERIHLRSDVRQTVALTCRFRPQGIHAWFDGTVDWTDKQFKRSLDIENPSLHYLLFRLSEEIRAPGFASDTLVELVSAEIVIELTRYCIGVEEPCARGGLAPWQLRLIDDRLTEPGDKPSLSELAQLCSVSPRQLTRAFRISRGCSVGSYIARSRIDKAKQFLRGGQPAKSIAHMLGFNSPSHFCAAFLRATGESTRQYRKRYARASVSVE